jgi:hypothetical protein
MNQISLHSINLENADTQLTFKSSDAENGLQFKLSKVHLTLSFDHWLELETAKTEEEWGVGLIEVNDLEFDCLIQAHMVEDKWKATVKSFNMKISGQHEMFLYTQTDSKFSELLKQFAGVFS